MARGTRSKRLIPAVPVLRVRESIPKDAKKLARVLRPEDRDEIAASTGLEPAQELLRAIHGKHNNKADNRSFSVVEGKKILAMFGVSTCRLEGRCRVGAPWLLASPEMFDTHRRYFIRHSPVWIEELSQGYGLLENLAYAENTVHLCWLERMGFQLVRLIPHFGVADKPFWLFRKFTS